MRKHSPQSRKYPSLNNKQITKETVINEQKDVYVDNKFITLMEEQDIIEGYWDENKITENILNSPELKDVCNKIRSLLEEKSIDKDDKRKILTTIAILYYIIEKNNKEIKKEKLIINKANKFLSLYNLDYKIVISSIK